VIACFVDTDEIVNHHITI